MTCVWWIVIKKELKTKIYDKSERESTSFYDGKSVLGWLIFYVVCLVYKTEHFSTRPTDAVISWHPENKSKPQNYSKKSHYITHCGVFLFSVTRERHVELLKDEGLCAGRDKTQDSDRTKWAINYLIFFLFLIFLLFLNLFTSRHLGRSLISLHYFSLFQVNKSQPVTAV